ncbi:hypothetical protein QYM36_004185 [Artemia franciscana]|uniref:F-box domain-containing protein n=1 Tax=Artemia franciscana TaxID=6661 RepID=A0AA88LCB4_ARTSF|nr:hypothetical protein QYM36_004185 [Artemia franciscana]
MQTKEEVPTSTNKEVTSEAENDATLQKDIRINARSGVSQNLAGFFTQYTELKDQLKLSQSIEDLGLALRTTGKVLAECISARLLDKPDANISKLDPSKKRHFAKICDPGNKALNPKKRRKTRDLSYEYSSPLGPAKAESVSTLLPGMPYTPGANAKNLPPEVILYIAKFLDVKSVYKLTLTSRYMNNILDDDSLWKCIFYREIKSVLKRCETATGRIPYRMYHYPYMIDSTRELMFKWRYVKERFSSQLHLLNCFYVDGKHSNWKVYYDSLYDDYEEYARVLAVDRRWSTLATLAEYRQH